MGRMRFPSVIAFFICVNCFIIQDVFSQGVSRSWGFGCSLSYWKYNNERSEISLDQAISISGLGASLFFFTRLHVNLFIEASFKATADVLIDERRIDGDDVDVTAVLPILFGFRYDILPSRIACSFQPYLGLGVGPYCIVNTYVREEYYEQSTSIDTDFKFGGYAGAGLHVLLKNWFALHYDMKYHFIDFHSDKDYGGFELSTGLCFMLGSKRQIFDVEQIKIIVHDVYPAYLQFYNTYPVALMTVKNTVGYPIEVNIKSEVKEYSERPRESGFVQLGPGETKDIPIYALFGRKLLQTTHREPAVIDLEVEARAGSKHVRTFSEQIMIHNRNAWTGEIDKLGFFITPDDEKILQMGRHVAQQTETAHDGLQSFNLARLLFDELARMGIRYHRDPNIPFFKDDRVQFASETLFMKTGDCDDLAVLVSSMLESVGIQTAFVDVEDPQKDIAHVYLMFDSGLEAHEGGRISSNDKRLVIREDESGQRSIWIPLETTFIAQGFDAAWQAGALQHLQEGILRQGLVQGWVRIIDVD